MLREDFSSENEDYLSLVKVQGEDTKAAENFPELCT